MIVLVGTGDISSPADAVNADQIIQGHRQLTARAHAKGFRIFGGTLIPNEGFPGAGVRFFSGSGEAPARTPALFFGGIMRHTFQAEQWVPYSRERVFAFFADPANLPPLMPGWQQARLERAHYVPPSAPPVVYKAGLAAGQGSLISISFRPIPFIPIRLGWDAYIAEFRWNDCFCDEQQRGPFRYFRHCHRVQAEAREGVPGSLVSDAVEYELPMGALGDFANRVSVTKQMRMLFEYRQRRLPGLLARA